MAIIKDLDMKWFWMGYSMGGNSRKKFLDSPNKILNLGKQGVKLVPTQKQKVSFFIGLQMGRGKIVQNFDVVKVIQYQDKDSHKSKGDYLTAAIGSIETVAGASISLPFSILNNSVDNRGYIGYQYKMKYPTHLLTLNSITQSSNWSGSFKYLHDAENGIVQVQGMNSSVSYDDAVFGYLNFRVSSDAVGTFYVYMQGPSGEGTATDILTQINGENYYIQPLSLENGEIKILSDGEEHDDTKPPVGQESVTLPPIGTTEDPIGPDVDFTYDFDLDLEYVGDGEGSGANLKVEITFGDGSSEIVEIPLQEGSHHYNGKIPIKLPSLKPGPIVIEIWVEPNDPNDIYYWFIKAGALWGFESEVPRDEVHNIPIVIPKVSIYDGFRIKAEYRLSFEESGGGDVPVVVDKVVIGEIMQLYDEFALDIYDVLEEIELSDLGISDGFRITFEGGLIE